MKRFIIPIILGLSTASASAGCRLQRGDDMKFDGDKRAHLTWNAAGNVALAGANAAFDLGLSNKSQFLIGQIPGVLREIKTGCLDDGPGGFSIQDIAYNAIGGAIGTAIGNGIVIMLTPRSVHVAMEF